MVDTGCALWLLMIRNPLLCVGTLPPEDAEPASHHRSRIYRVLIFQLPLQLGCKHVTPALQIDVPTADAVELEACERNRDLPEPLLGKVATGAAVLGQ